MLLMFMGGGESLSRLPLNLLKKKLRSGMPKLVITIVISDLRLSSVEKKRKIRQNSPARGDVFTKKA